MFNLIRRFFFRLSTPETQLESVSDKLTVCDGTTGKPIVHDAVAEAVGLNARCYYCREQKLVIGPRGGASTNLLCDHKGCGARFNMHGGGPGGLPLMGVDVITPGNTS